MSAWVQGGLLSGALVAGFLAGWFGGRALGLRMPSVWISTAVLVAGSLGGPLLTWELIGRGPLSYVAALVIAGGAAGIVFWPMGLPQGEREWL